MLFRQSSSRSEESSRILDTFYYLYGESYKSEIRTLSTAARRSILSIVGEYVSLAMLLIVDFEIPVKVASCRADTFLLYIISANNIFMLLLFTVFIVFIRKKKVINLARKRKKSPDYSDIAFLLWPIALMVGLAAISFKLMLYVMFFIGKFCFYLTWHLIRGFFKLIRWLFNLILCKIKQSRSKTMCNNDENYDLNVFEAKDVMPSQAIFEENVTPLQNFSETPCNQDISFEKEEISSLQNHDVKDINVVSTVSESTLKNSLEVDPHFIAAGRFIIEKERGSIGILQRLFKIGFNRAAKIMDQLCFAGVVGPEEGTKPREILMSMEQFESFLSNTELIETPSSNCTSCGINSTVHPSSNPATDRVQMYNGKYDYMEGHDFEQFCAKLLEANGFCNVRVTQESNDQGIDILAEKLNVKYAVQCKCYSSDVGNKAVQEVFAGKSYYDCHVGVVLTNRYFTRAAKELAQKTQVSLWDRDMLEKLIENTNT